MIILLAGCGGGSSTSLDTSGAVVSGPAAPTATPSPERLASTLAVLGNLQGQVGASILQGAKTTSFTGATNQPVLVGDGDLPPSLVDVYAAGQPIVLIAPDQARVNALRALLGMSADYVFPTGVQRLVYYGLSNGAGADAQLVGYPDTGSHVAKGEQGNLDDQAPMADEVVDLPEDAGTYDQEAQAVLQFIGEHRDWPLADKAKDEPNGGAPTPGLTFPLSKVRRSELTSTFTFEKQEYRVKTTIWAVHQVDTGYDYFFVQQTPTYAPNGSMIRDRDDDRGWYANFYQTVTSVDGMQGDPQVELATNIVDTFPKTTEGATEISSTIGFTLGGKFTYQDAADKGVTKGGEVSGTLSFSDTAKFSIPDMRIQSLVGDRGNTAGWKFLIYSPNGITWTCRGPNFGALQELPTLAKSTFQPKMFWAWRVDPRVRARFPKGLPLRIDMTAQISRLRLLVPCIGTHQSMQPKPDELIHRPDPVKWPPM